MSKSLIIAEKPSVARDLASALGRVERRGDRYENDRYIITSALGHIVELNMPEDFDRKLRYWRLDTLPIIPGKFQLKPIEKTRAKFAELKRQLHRKDVAEVVNACDAGREGELIFTYLFESAKCRKPVRRLWMQSMTRQAITRAFSRLIDGEKMKPLQDAARSRSEADWLIGINGTRAVTIRMYGRSHGNVATVGRVQTPTLNLVVERDREIHRFQPQAYWRITATFSIVSGSYKGIYQKPENAKGQSTSTQSAPTDRSLDRRDRIWDQAQASTLLEEIQGHEFATVRETKKRIRQVAPRLYDLTSLQREANRRYGISARQTLSYAQSLYERHKVITYPRTDSRALPEDYLSTCKVSLAKLPAPLSESAQLALASGWVRPNRRIFNNSQISDHFAIVPTGESAAKLTRGEAQIFDMIARRFVAAFYPPAEFDVTTRTSMVGRHPFETKGRVLINPGWLAVYGKKSALKEALPPLTGSDGSPPVAGIEEVKLEKEMTKPPAHYTEATLLSAMEGAGKLVDEEELAKAMKEKGLGTPATRAQIIEQLISQKYLERKKRELICTTKAENLVDFLNAVHVESLTSPSMTGDWEHKLHLVETGKLSRDEFMRGITQMISQIVDRTRSFDDAKASSRETTVLSPTDGKPMLETFRAFKSRDGKLVIYKTMGNRRITEKEVQTLVTEGSIGPLTGFRSKAGRKFTASLRLNDEYRIVFDFENSNEAGSRKEERMIDLSEHTIVGPCPTGCARDSGSANVYLTDTAFRCENGLNGTQRCNFRISRSMLGRTLPVAQARKLLSTGKTDLIPNFKSKRTHREFSAFLVLKPAGKIGFEFPPRPPRGKK